MNTSTNRHADDTITGPTNSDLSGLCDTLADRAVVASRALAVANSEVKNAWLLDAARRIEASAEEIVEANRRDLEAAPSFGLTEAQIDRLRTKPETIRTITTALIEVAALPDPVGERVEGSLRPNGLEVSRVRVPIGVVFMIYESRPNVTADAAALCLKSGNAVILRGGKEAFHTNTALHRILVDPLEEHGLPRDAVQLVPTTDRQAVGLLLGMGDQIDLAIPRGGPSLIRRVADEATMPVLKHYDGNCHLYIDKHADPVMAVAIAQNAKLQRVGVCNAIETLLVHKNVASTILPQITDELIGQGAEIRGDAVACQHDRRLVPATPEDWDTEFLAPILAVAVVDTLDGAIAHIARHGSRHTDAIVTDDLTSARRFVAAVDSACVLVNASTRFNDGNQLGLGAEIGISTDKFHARGPCGLRELTTVKWVVYGDGHIRT